MTLEPQRLPVLEVRDLTTRFHTERGVARAIDSVGFDLFAGETLALVGESGSGKSVTALSILRLIQPPGEIVSGEVRLLGRELHTLAESELRRVRGAEIALVFQEPLSALDPVFTIGEQIAEVLRAHGRANGEAAREGAIALLARVGIADPRRCAAEIPSRLSGGMRQRALIAMAIACGPKVLIADEPTTALDATLQAEILDLLATLQREERLAMLLIAHDLALVAERATRVAVMYAGHIVEESGVDELFARPRHPYTILLLRSLPGRARGEQSHAALSGTAHGPLHHPSGCRFRLRCPLATEVCATSEPLLEEHGAALRRVACHHVEEAKAL